MASRTNLYVLAARRKKPPVYGQTGVLPPMGSTRLSPQDKLAAQVEAAERRRTQQKNQLAKQYAPKPRRPKPGRPLGY